MSKRQERCETCRFWDTEDTMSDPPEGEQETRRCKRRAPVLTLGMVDPKNNSGSALDFACWPMTASDEWCGEWQGNEEQKETHSWDATDRDLRYRFILGGDQPEKARQKAMLCERFLKLMREGYSSDEVRRIFRIRPRNKKLAEVLLVAEQIMNESRQEATNAKE